MGCCVSSDRTATFQKHESLQPPKSVHESRAPPPSFDELEAVKEVLSETPNPKPPPPLAPPPIKNPHQQHHHQDQDINLSKKKIQSDQRPSCDKKLVKNEKIFQQEEISEQDVSEVCSLSYSESVSTTTINNDRRDYHDDNADDQEVKQRVTRSPAPKLPLRNRGDLGPRQDQRVVGKSPSRRPEQSPSKRNINAGCGGGGGGSVRMVQSREPGTGGVVGRRGLRSDPNRRDPGESSWRRSRSPATNRSVVGRNPSIGRTNPSPGRVRKDPHEGGGDGGSSRVDSGIEANNKWPNNKNRNADNTGATSESLENPLVSLECFIFL